MSELRRVAQALTIMAKYDNDEGGLEIREESDMTIVGVDPKVMSVEDRKACRDLYFHLVSCDEGDDYFWIWNTDLEDFEYTEYDENFNKIGGSDEYEEED